MHRSLARPVAFLVVGVAGFGVGQSVAHGQQFEIRPNDIVIGELFERGPSYNGPHNGPGNYQGAVSDGGFNAFDTWMYPQTEFGGLSLNRRVDTLSAINTYRHIETYSNTTAGTLSVPLDMFGGLGFGGADVILRDDAFAGVSTDRLSFSSMPVIGFMNGNNGWTAANIVRARDGNSVALNYTLTIEPGQSVSLMWATFLARDISNRSGDVALAQNTVSAMLADPMGTGLYAGLSTGEIGAIVNWSVPAPGAAAILCFGGLLAARRRR